MPAKAFYIYPLPASEPVWAREIRVPEYYM